MSNLTLDEFRVHLLSSLLCFIEYFFELRNNRAFRIPFTSCARSHYLTMIDELELVFDLQTTRLIINIPPGHGKSTILVYFVAWAMAHYPDCKFIYVSVGYELAETHVSEIKAIMSLPEYYMLLGTKIDPRNNSRGDFRTTAGGRVVAKGATGTIVGLDAGLPFLDRFSGGEIIDDAHNPDDVHSDTMRNSVIKNYNETLKHRIRGPNVPLIFIGQRLRQDDLADYLLSGKDGVEWRSIIIPAIDAAGNALCPEIKSIDWLNNEKTHNEYSFWAQYMQYPRPAGGGIFKEDSFIALHEEPKILELIITVDTAETDKNYNDPTVFSLFGVYKILINGQDSGLYGLHWMDCEEDWINAADIYERLFSFYSRSLTAARRLSIAPPDIAIERKNTGVTLLESAKRIPGLRVIDIERTKASGNKTSRYIEVSPFVSRQQITVPAYAKHVKMVIEHMGNITTNNSHAHDDIADTLYDAVKLKLITGLIHAEMLAGKQNVKDIVSANQQYLMNAQKRNKWK